MQLPLCVDDFGTNVYACFYTGILVWADRAVVIGAIIPRVKTCYVIAMTDEAKNAHKASGIAFHENEANCNTCRFLKRVKHNKNVAGFLYGRCTSSLPNIEANPYFNRMEGDVMMFHPEDPMNMPCYVPRWKTSNYVLKEAS